MTDLAAALVTFGMVLLVGFVNLYFGQQIGRNKEKIRILKYLKERAVLRIDETGKPDLERLAAVEAYLDIAKFL